MELSITGPKILWEIPILGGIKITETVVASAGIVVVVWLLCLVLTHRLETVPRRRTQLIAEKLVTAADRLVGQTMGEKRLGWTPFMMALMAASVLGSLISLLGLRPVTADINTTMSWAALAFLLIQGSGIRHKGIGGYLKGFLEPVPFLLPLNVIGEVSTPVSMGFRHFGNIAAGTIITSLLYAALGSLTSMLGIGVPILQVGLPAVLSIYFDLFTALLQAFIFTMLTMVFVANAAD